MREKTTVLLTNDDGYFSEGIKCLYETLVEHYSVIIVAPDSEKSGVGHSFTYKQPLFYNKINNGYAKDMYSVSGTPADCVKFAVSYLLPNKPDIVISGLNNGENSGISSYYSGTVAAAREGAFWKIKSFAFSLCEEAIEFSGRFIKMIPTIIDELIVFKAFFLSNYFLNVNFPPCSPDLIKGIKITKQSLAFFDDRYRKVSINDKKNGYFIYGNKIDIEEDDSFDSSALKNNWITITPLSFDSTVHKEIKNIKKIEKRFINRGIQ